MRLIITLFLTTILPAISFGQFWTNPLDEQHFIVYDGPDFVLLKGQQDTIFCDKVEMKMSSNDPVKLAFKIDDRDTVINGRGCLNAIAFQTEGVLMELMPANPEKPHKAHQHMFRSADGYITIWSNDHKYVDKFKKPNELGRDHQIQYILASVDGGPIFIPSFKNYKKNMMPLFKDCDEMDKSGFSEYLSGVIRLSKSYNETCGKNK